ncbi:adenylate and guanylate cyclase catalytic domain-domain-containing protein [Catenaria anguillulae PL171]|uniref:adenylate cyclase n=1 Tax=Catenaria anguillulae PL171 TaxID=765915 RepID=A0A1Y2H6X6_9FUNG|nr:adenylate and guanylate cyclase catalytic domain-domain-containing protein [Catenaria anguillulae PL171]
MGVPIRNPFKALKLAPDLEELYQVYFYHQNKAVLQTLISMVALLNLSYLAFNFYLYPYALHLNLPGPALGLFFVVFSFGWMRYGPQEDDLTFPNIVVGLAVGSVLLSNNLMRSTCWVTGIYWDNALHLNHLLFCGFVYWLLRAPFPHRCMLGWIFTVLQITIDVTAGCSEAKLAASSLVYIATNIIGMSFAYFSEMANRNAFLRTREVYKHQGKLHLAKEQSEALLRMVLPARVIEDLKRGVEGAGYLNGRSSFQELNRVTILFADIVGFTEFSSRVSAVKLVLVLSDMFSEIDSVTEALGLEKIKTIGDCYQCCGGVPEPVLNDEQAADWVLRMIKLGVEIIQGVNKTARRIKYPLRVRVGIHTGSVMAGIMGIHKLKYDVWSKDVDIASLMEQSATADIPHISAVTYNYLVQHGRDEGMVLTPGPDVSGDEPEHIKTFHVSAFSFTKIVDGAFVSVVHPLPSVPASPTSPMGLSQLPPSNVPRAPPDVQQPDASEATASSQQATANAATASGPATPVATIPVTISQPPSSNAPIIPPGLEDPTQDTAGLGGASQKPISAFLSSANEDGLLLDDPRALRESVQAQRKLYSDFERQLHWPAGTFRDAKLEEDYKNDYMEHHGMDLVYAMGVVASVRGLYLIGTALVLTPSVWGYVGDALAVSVLIIAVMVTAKKYRTQSMAEVQAQEKNYSGLWIGSERDLGSVDSVAKFARWHRWQPNWLCIGSVFLPILGDLVRLQFTPVLYPSFQYSALLMVMFSTTLFIGLRTRVLSFFALAWVPVYSGLYYLGISRALGMWAPLQLEVGQALLTLAVTVVVVLTTNKSMDLQFRRNFQMKRFLEGKLNEIRIVQKDTERLLLNIFPLDVAQRLRVNPTLRIADALEDVSIIFGYISNFDTLDLPPAIALKLLNEVICDIDELCVRHHVEKIKTIGTKYLAMTKDEPHPSNVPHAVRMADFALDLRQVISSYNDQFFSHMYCNNFMVRIGINCGPVVAGVIGTSKYSFDVWGDSVNVSSRMESNGQDNMIHVSQSVYDKLYTMYEFQSRGLVPVKGKGLMSTHFLLGRRKMPLSASVLSTPADGVGTPKKVGGSGMDQPPPLSDVGPGMHRISSRQAGSDGYGGPGV